MRIVNVELAEITGAFIGDGYLSRYGNRQYLLGFAGHSVLDKAYFQHLFVLIKRNFPSSNPHIYFRSDENTVMLKVYSKAVFLSFKKLGFSEGEKSRTVKIPLEIASEPKLMNACLRGIFDTDGCVFLDRRKKYLHPYPRITLQSASLDLISQIEAYLLRTFDLYVNKANRDGYRNYVEIYGHRQVEIFLKQIGFSNDRHLSKLMPP